MFTDACSYSEGSLTPSCFRRTERRRRRRYKLIANASVIMVLCRKSRRYVSFMTYPGDVELNSGVYRGAWYVGRSTNDMLSFLYLMKFLEDCSRVTYFWNHSCCLFMRHQTSSQTRSIRNLSSPASLQGRLIGKRRRQKTYLTVLTLFVSSSKLT